MSTPSSKPPARSLSRCWILVAAGAGLAGTLIGCTTEMVGGESDAAPTMVASSTSADAGTLPDGAPIEGGGR